MKKLNLLILVLVCWISSNSVFALEGTGTIQEIRMCTYSTPGSSHKNFIFFRLSDGGWYGLYGHYVAVANGTYSGGDTPSQSIVFLAYANNHRVSVRATYTAKTECNVTAPMIWDGGGDYISISKD